MIFLPKLGNIKIGGVEKGVPVKYNKIHVTTTSKEGEENFQLHPAFKEPVKKIKILLPFVINPENNFIYDKISFVIVNGVYRFYAKKINDMIYLFPYQMDVIPNIEGGKLPVIQLGKAENWEENLDMQYRGLLYTYVIDPEKNTPLDLIDDTVGVFFYKTANPYSVNEIQNTIEILKSFYQNKSFGASEEKIAKQLRFAPLTLEMHTKLVDINSGREETYLRMLPPSMKDISASINISKEFSEMFKYLINIEKAFTESRKEEIEKALTLEEFKKLIGTDIHIVTEKIFDNLVKNSNTNKKAPIKAGINANRKNENSQKKQEFQKKAAKICKELNLDRFGVKESLIASFMNNTGKSVRETKKILKELIESEQAHKQNWIAVQLIQITREIEKQKQEEQKENSQENLKSELENSEK